MGRHATELEPGSIAPAVLPPHAIFCPVGRALDVLGDRWTLVLLRHLLHEPRGFQELRMRCGIAPRVLSARLRKLIAAGFVRRVSSGVRSHYEATGRGRSLEPVITAIARWYLRQGLSDLRVNPKRFNATSAQSILESLPFMLREDRAAGADLTFEVRLTGEGGGVWNVHIRDGACMVRCGFAERADVRYTADARLWCAVALGSQDTRTLYRQGLITKDGGRERMDHYFYQIAGWRAGAARHRDRNSRHRRNG